MTCCTAARTPCFTRSDAVQHPRTILLRTAAERSFSVVAEVWMPDHVHVMLTGETTSSDFRRTMKTIRQRTAVNWGGPLWQDGYYEHVVRPEETELFCVEYIIQNPVEAGLVDEPAKYPFLFLKDEYREFFSAILSSTGAA